MPLNGLKFSDPIAARAEIRDKVINTPYAQMVWDLLEEDCPDNLELYLQARLPLELSVEEIQKAMQVGAQAYQYLNESRHQKAIDEYNKSAAEYYSKNSTEGDF